MTETLILRQERPPPGVVLLVHYGAGTQSLDQLVKNSLTQYRAYGPVLETLGRDAAGALALSVYAVRVPNLLGALLSEGRRRGYDRYGRSNVDAVASAGYELWPTSPSDEGSARFAEHHFDIPVAVGGIGLAGEYQSLGRGQRRELRRRFHDPFQKLLELFEPRRDLPKADPGLA